MLVKCGYYDYDITDSKVENAFCNFHTKAVLFNYQNKNDLLYIINSNKSYYATTNRYYRTIEVDITDTYSKQFDLTISQFSFLSALSAVVLTATWLIILSTFKIKRT